ncbi:hypothetical protein JCM21531_2855 [Acetivibrio straminisolvens JCM 21531]|uniref:Uncharacterized protein n=1 Tax=Acetivibrio straminisolvens JCM 21531 TaxID=1294263 RepID=W4V9B0_9FIRM|nr:hypothetical protein JCM21531_2855 [Acetivibrio straminisolvens JCM 21531]
MRIETIIEISSLIITAVLLLILIPKNKIREAIVIFSFKQMITWLLGLFVAEFNLIEYPIRLFANATKASFTFEYFVYPSICVVFNLYYPENKSLLRKTLHYVVYTTAITVFELILEKYTENIRYTNWTWYYTFSSVYFTFFLSRTYYKWFYKKAITLLADSRRVVAFFLLTALAIIRIKTGSTKAIIHEILLKTSASNEMELINLFGIRLKLIITSAKGIISG